MGKTRQGSRGISLVEICVGICISAVLAAQAIPALEQIQERQRLHLLAQTLMTDLQQARSEAVHYAQTVHLRFDPGAQGSCYLLHTGQAGQCRCDEGGVPVCKAEGKAIKLQWLPSQQHVLVQANVTQMSFAPRQGTVSSTGSIDITGRNGDGIRLVVSIAGRVRTCSPQGRVNPYPKCLANPQT